MYRYWSKIICSLLLVLMVGSSVSAESMVRVGVLQYVEHDSLDQNYEGFVAGLEEAGYVEGDNLRLDYLNASGNSANLQSMSERLAHDNDYFFAISTPAAQSMANVETKRPIYISSVSDPIDAGLAKDLDQPEGNITGTIDAGPIEQQIDLLLNVVPDAKRVGLIYNSGEANSQSEAQLAKEALEEREIEVIEATVTSTNDISQVMEALVKNDIDALYTVTDNTIASAMTLVGDIAIGANLPLIGGSKDMVLENGLATYGLDYYELGKQTARMLVRQIEDDLSIEDLPFERAEQLELVVNERVAEALNIDPSQIKINE